MKYPRTHFEIYPGDKGWRLEIHTEQQPTGGRSYGDKTVSVCYFSSVSVTSHFLSKQMRDLEKDEP